MRILFRNAALITLFIVFSRTSFVSADENTNTKFRVGIILPLSGPVAEFGSAFRNGIELRARKSGGFSTYCDVKYEDSHYDPKTALAAFNKLHDIDHVNLVYNFGGPTTEAVAPVAEAKRLPLVTSEVDPAFSAGRGFVIRFNNPAAKFGKLMAEYLSSQGAKRLAIIKVDNQFIESMLMGLRDSLTKDQTLEIVDTYQPGETDFHTSITKLRSASYDAFGVYLMSGQISVFYRQLAEQKLKVKTFGTDFFESKTEIGNAAGSMEGAVYPNNFVKDSFVEEYKKLYGNDLQIVWGAFGYEFMSLVVENFCKTPIVLTSKEIIQKFSEVQNREGVLGLFNFEQSGAGDRYFSFPAVIRKVHNDRIITVLSTDGHE